MKWQLMLLGDTQSRWTWMMDMTWSMDKYAGFTSGSII